MFGVSFEWDQTDQAALRRRLADRRTRAGWICAVAADPVERFIGLYGDMVVEAAQTRLRQHTDTGDLARSVIFTWGTQGGEVAAAEYGGYLDQGTRPHWPPIQAVAGWAERHGIPPFLVARKIAEEGTDPTRWLTGALADAERRLPQLLRDTATAVEMHWNRGL